jgi:pimeloyl-ACP methyl ester carboxylesterase
MTSKPWTYESYQTSGREGNAPVPGGMLNYRLAGPANAEDVVVFESGWTAPFPYAVWLEEALALHVRVLSYDRAGVGDSRSMAPLTPQGLTEQLTALLSSLGIQRPVIVVGHSYGGLIGALHAAEAPAMVRAVVQIDPTPEFDNGFIDPSLRMLPSIARFMQLCALLKIDGPLFLNLAKELPPEIFARVKRNSGWLVRSFNGSIAEIRLLDGIRRIIAASGFAKQCPRLVISGDPAQAPNSWLRKLLMNDEKARNYWDAVHELHQRQASLNDASRWMRLPCNHVSLVTNRASAEEVASNILGFIR